jgi:trk system potassium uptake protein TrkA
MRVIIAGAGEIGWYIAGDVSADGHDVTIIDDEVSRIRQVNSALDVKAINGSAGSAHVLIKAGVMEADLVVAVTGSDETNIVCGSVAKKLGARKVICRVDEVVYRKAPEISYRDHFEIDELVSPQMFTALELASVIRNPGSLAVEHFARGQLEMQQIRSDKAGEWVGKPLKELTLPEGVRLCSINRDGDFKIPQASDTVEANDLITIIGKTEQVVEARAGFEGKGEPRKVVIMGGGHTAVSLARRLRIRSFRLTIIERDGDRCRELADALPTVTILNGDATSLSFLKEERVDNAAVFVSTTSSDEANIMSAIQAKNLGVEKVLVVIHRPDYANLMEKIGIDRAISPRVVMAREAVSLLRKGNISTLVELGGGTAEILEIRVKGEDFVGKKLRDIEMPGTSLVLTLQREHEVMVPQAETVFQLDDIVLIICLKDQHKEIAKLISGD